MNSEVKEENKSDIKSSNRIRFEQTEYINNEPVVKKTRYVDGSFVIDKYPEFCEGIKGPYDLRNRLNPNNYNFFKRNKYNKHEYTGKEPKSNKSDKLYVTKEIFDIIKNKNNDIKNLKTNFEQYNTLYERKIKQFKNEYKKKRDEYLDNIRNIRNSLV
jgi:hypothetical protein